MNAVILLVVVWLANAEQPVVYAYPTADMEACFTKRAAAQDAANLPGVMGVTTGCIQVSVPRAEHADEQQQ